MDGDVPPLSDLWRLKMQYGFILYCDEAHSFLSVGSTGFGCLQYWNETHTRNIVPWDLIDVRTGTLSKAIGGIGGFIAGKPFLRDRIRDHIRQIDDSDNISIPSSTMVQTLLVLGQPSRIAHHLHRLSTISKFCRSELARFGVYVYGEEEATPILPVWAGRPSTSARLSYAFRKEGLLASPVTTPAVPFWESRVRVNLSADYSDADVDRLIDAIIAGSISVGVCKKQARLVRRRFNSQSLVCLDFEPDEDEATATVKRIRELICQSSLALQDAHDAESLSSYPHMFTATNVTKAGHKARLLYGIGAGSARWISGTFPPHLSVEKLLAEVLDTESSMTYADATIGLASTIAALARPVLGAKRHFMLYPRDARGAVRDGLALIPPKDKKGPTQKVLGYESAEGIEEQVRKLASAGVCFTVFLDGLDIDIISGLMQAAGHCPLTILVHSPSRLLDRQEILGDPSPLHKSDTGGSKVELLVYGSFSKTFGLPGGYLAGSEALIRELRYTSRGYMYTTSTAPFLMDMVRVALVNSVARS